jgi:hypothetical protein
MGSATGGQDGTVESPLGQEFAKDRLQADSLLRKQSEAMDYAQRMSSGSLMDPSAKVQFLESLGAAGRQQLANAANDGIIHSGALGQARRALAKKQAIGQAAIVAEEERARREMLGRVEEMRNVTRQAYEETMPERKTVETGVSGLTESYDVEPEKRALYEKRDLRLQQMIANLDKARLPEEELRSRFYKEIDSTYAEASSLALNEARRLGMPEEYISGLARTLEQDKLRARRDSESLVRALSGPDPAAAAGVLQSLYTPEKVQVSEDVTNYGLPILFGLVGAAAGGLGGGGPAGAAAGWSIGSGLGSYASTLG